MLFEILAFACSGLFAGAAAYVTFVEHPARVSVGTAAAIAEFRPSYRRGSVMQASLAAVGLATAVRPGSRPATLEYSPLDSSSARSFRSRFS